MLYQKTSGPTDFDELRIIDSSNNEGTNSRITEIGQEGMIRWMWVHEGHHKTRNSWYLEMMMPISSILGLLVLYSKTFWVCDKLSDSFHGGLARVFSNFSVVLRVNNSLSGCVCYFFLASLLTIMSLDYVNWA